MQTLTMAGPNLHKLFSFAELRSVFGPLWVRCDRCRRFRSLRLTNGIRDLDWRMTRFKCVRCGGPGYCAIDRPNTQSGMEDYADGETLLAGAGAGEGLWDQLR